MDRTDAIRAALHAWRPGSGLLSLDSLSGGISSQMLRVRVGLPGGGEHTVIARFPGAYVRSLYPQAAAHEARTLRAVRQAGLPAPEPLAMGQAEDGDFLLIEFLPGAPTANPADPDAFVRQMAGALVQINTVAVEPFSFLMENKLDWTPSEGEPNLDLREPELNEAALRLRPASLGRLVLRHGDFWPGNVLWQDGKLTGIVDWENALRGPAAADLAIARLDIAWVFGFEGMDAFTAYYLEANPIDLRDLTYCELRAALRPMANFEEWGLPYAGMGRPDIDVASMRRTLLAFIEQALRKASG